FSPDGRAVGLIQGGDTFRVVDLASGEDVRKVSFDTWSGDAWAVRPDLKQGVFMKLLKRPLAPGEKPGPRGARITDLEGGGGDLGPFSGQEILCDELRYSADGWRLVGLIQDQKDVMIA